jgi:hypothetical protein
MLTIIAVFLVAILAAAGTWTPNNFLYKPGTGARGEAEKKTFDIGLDRIDARLGKEIWVGDPNYGATLQTAITAIGATATILRLPVGTHNIAADLSIPANIFLKPERGATFSISTTKTLTINGGLEAGLYQIFSCAGTGQVVFGNLVKEVHPEWWGATGAADDTAAVTAAVKSGVPVIFSAKRTYRIDSSFAIWGETGKEYALLGKPGSVIDGTLSNDNILMQISGYVVDPGGGVITGDPAKGAMSIVSAAASGFAAGDVLRIYSSDYWDPYISTPKAEMVQVDSIAGTTINLKSALQDSYTGANTIVSKILCPKVTVSGLTITRNANKTGLLVQYSKDVVIENNSVSGARDVAIRTNYIFGGVIRNNYATDCWYTGSGTSYGLQIGACQDVLVQGNRMFGGRHGIACGGSIPNRNVTITGNFIDNYHASNQYSLDTHANCEKFIIQGNIIKNGMIWSGTDAIIENNIIDSSTVDGLNVYPTKISNYKIFRGNVINTIGPHNGFMLEPFADNLSIGLLDVSGNYVTNTSNDRYGIQMVNSRFGYAPVGIGLLKVNGNTVIAVGQAFRFGNYTGVPTDFVVNEAQILGGFYKSTVSGTAFAYRPGLASGPVKIKDVYFEAPTYVFQVEYSSFADIQGCTFKATAASTKRLLTRYGTDLNFVGNTLINFAEYSGLAFDYMTGYVTARDNRFINCTGTPLSTALVTDYTSTRSGNRVVSLSAAPTSGTWKKGDVIYNSAPAAGGAAGWMCIASGTFSAFSQTGDTNGSTGVITNIADTSGVSVGNFVTVSAGFPSSSTPYRVLAVTATTITLDTSSNSVQTGVTVATPDPVFKGMGNLAQ